MDYRVGNRRKGTLRSVRIKIDKGSTHRGCVFVCDLGGDSKNTKADSPMSQQE